MRILEFVTELSDLLHLLLGFLVYFLSKVCSLLAFTIMLVYVVYQTFQREHPLESTKDIVEFITGIILGLLLS